MPYKPIERRYGQCSPKDEFEMEVQFLITKLYRVSAKEADSDSELEISSYLFVDACRGETQHLVHEDSAIHKIIFKKLTSEE